ncbi:MAG: tRNA (guanosine(37)-N1)-methyltransferase TrmD [Leptospiraceae bacterium]|nr:tRNA (guanosine(37)-N1)-methyltransferase TrmD [Leptospiraceae bacterium]
MQFNFLTLFPEKIQSYFASGLQAKAIENEIVKIKIIQLREFANNKHSKVDDTLYGGGAGMLMKVEPYHLALESLKNEKGYVILTSASGKLFTQEIARELASEHDKITFLSGYYEGVDHRVTEHLVDTELRLGNFVLSSGDLASLSIADSILRLVPGFLGGALETLAEESHTLDGVLEYPQFTKPAEFHGWKVPDVLLNGNHAAIEKWREENRKNLA